MTLSEFLRVYAARGPNLGWLLGAGASATSGIATAEDMVWDFKRTIYCAEQRVPIQACQDLSDPLVRRKLQGFFDGDKRYPAKDSDSEYAELFTIAYPNEADRRRYIERMVSVATPSYGHIAFAVLMAISKIRAVWTTNFDRNVEDAAAKIFGRTGRLAVATLDSARVAEECFQEQRWPLLVKLHGDFQSRRLKNTSQELMTQDELLRGSLVNACRQLGLIVAGYSGRDHSVMDAIEQAINSGAGYPSGFFWLKRAEATPFERAITVMEKARVAGIEVHEVEITNFDELLADLLLMVEDLPSEFAQQLDAVAPRMTDAPMQPVEGGWPVVRLNALPITSFPTVCRRVTCDVGGMKEVRKLVQDSNKNIIAARRRVGIIAFGRDGDVREVFAPHNIREWDLHAIEPERLSFDSMEMSLVYDALVRALARERTLIGCRRHNLHVLAIDPKNLNSDNYVPLRALGTLSGIIPKIGIWWSEAIIIRLEQRQDRLWLLIEPSAWVDSLPGKKVADEVKEFHRRRAAGRYNKNWNALVEAWSQVLTHGEATGKVSALGIADGIDATFEINRVTAFSRRATSR